MWSTEWQKPLLLRLTSALILPIPKARCDFADLFGLDLGCISFIAKGVGRALRLRCSEPTRGWHCHTMDFKNQRKSEKSIDKMI